MALVKDDETSEPSYYTLIQNISFNELESLKMIFTAKSENTGGPSDGLDEEDFTNAVTEVFNGKKYKHQSAALFSDITRRCKSRITWLDFLDFLLKNLTPSLKTLNLQVSAITLVPHTKRETIVKIVLIETKKYFCYAMISKHGRVGLYDGNLDFLTTYHLIMTREDIRRKEEQKRRRNRWITDAIFCEDILMFIATNSTRSVVIYEASGLKHVPLWLVLSTPNIVECFAYRSYNNNVANGQSSLFMGDSNGVVLSFNFLQPKVGLLRKKHNDKINLFYWDELPDEKDFIIVKNHGRLHKEVVKHLTYCEENNTLISCSRDENLSIIIKYMGNKNKPSIFKMHKGTNCFALSIKRKILITGSENGILRLWNLLITSKPIATLKEQNNSPIVDVKIMEKQNLFLSCSSDGVLKLWDITEQKCIQTIALAFPSFEIFGKLIEWGTNSIYPGPKRISFEEYNLELWERSPMIVTCCNYIALIKITYQDKEIGESLKMNVLPPPPLQNSVLVPKSWRTSDDIRNIYKNKPQEIDSDVIEKKLKELDFILERDFFADNGSNGSDINFKIATLERKKLYMQTHVERGAPYLALELHETEDLQLTPDLPVPDKKRIKNVAEKVDKVLKDATFRDLVFSEPSSSRSPRSSRSSVVEFDY